MNDIAATILRLEAQAEIARTLGHPAVADGLEIAIAAMRGAASPAPLPVIMEPPAASLPASNAALVRRVRRDHDTAERSRMLWKDYENALMREALTITAAKPEQTPYATLADALGRSQAAIWSQAKRLGLFPLQRVERENAP